MRGHAPSVHPPNRRTKPPPAPDESPVSSAAPASKGAPSSRGRAAPEVDVPAPARPRSSRPRKGAPSAKVGNVKRPSAWLQKLQLITGISVVVAASVLVAWGMRRYLHKSPRFAVANVLVEGAQRLTSARVSRAAGIATGNNIFDVDEDTAAKKVLADPWVESAKVRKELPDTLHVTIVERDPRLLASIDGKLFLVDGKGSVFKEAEPGDPVDFPVVTGIRTEELTADREAVMRRLRDALELLAILDEGHVSERFPVQELHLDGLGNVTVTAGAEGMALVFGEPPYRAKAQKAVRIFSELRARQAKADVLFLDNRSHPERVVVRMRNEQKVAKSSDSEKGKP